MLSNVSAVDFTKSNDGARTGPVAVSVSLPVAPPADVAEALFTKLPVSISACVITLDVRQVAVSVCPTPITGIVQFTPKGASTTTTSRRVTLPSLNTLNV